MSHLSRPVASSLLTAAVAAALVVGPSFAVAATPDQANGADRTFAGGNEQVNLTEIAFGQVGVRRAHSAAVKTLAEVTLKQHLQTRTALEAVARRDGLPLPTRPNAVQRQQLHALETVSAAEFDRLFISLEVKGHIASITHTKFEFQAGSSSSVERYAHYYLPIAEHHLMMAEADQRSE